MKIKVAIILLAIISLINARAVGQEKRLMKHEIGINTLQLLATTLDLNYNIAYQPWYSISIHTGYTFNYSYSIDLPGFFLSPHIKGGNDGYELEKQSGGFLKAGLKFNLRRTLERRNYFFVGGFFTNALVYEEATLLSWKEYDAWVEQKNHTVYIVGLTGAAGYNFKLSAHLDADIGVQISGASGKYKDLYGYKNYIPGMGYYENDGYGNGNLFPMLMLNLKYKLN